MKFSGVTILQGVEFCIFLLILNGPYNEQCSATALPVIIFNEQQVLIIFNYRHKQTLLKFKIDMLLRPIRWRHAIILVCFRAYWTDLNIMACQFRIIIVINTHTSTTKWGRRHIANKNSFSSRFKCVTQYKNETRKEIFGTFHDVFLRRKSRKAENESDVNNFCCSQTALLYQRAQLVVVMKG